MIEDPESRISIDTRRRQSRALRKQEGFCPFDIPGVSKIILSVETQNFLKCVVGDQVSVETPWTLIRKELFEEHMELDTQSEFHLFREKIREYQAPEVLIGWVALTSEEDDWFYFVYTLDAREKVEKIVQRKKAEVQRKVDRLIYRPILQWKNLGSDSEVDPGLLKTNRSLYQVELRTKFPLRDTKTTFKLKTVSEIPNGYIELLPEDRVHLELVKKRRVDVAIQAITEKITREVQTTTTYPLNIWTQYAYEYKPPKLEDDEPVVEDKRKPQVKKIYPKFKTEYMVEAIEQMEEHIRINPSLNLYEDDYAILKLQARSKVRSIERIPLKANFSNLHLSRSKSISDVVWDPFRFGRIATSYCNTPLNLFSKPSTLDEVLEITYGYSPVLLWSYQDTISPRHHLETSRQVTALSFCPYERDLLVGGMQNGQITIWKLPEHLDVEKLSSNQEKSRKLLYDILHWDDSIWHTSMIKPRMVSLGRDSQKQMISSIKWMPQNLSMTASGKFEKVQKRQFLSTSLDGTIAFWDLDQKQERKVRSGRSRRPSKVDKVSRPSRLKKRPSALERKKVEYLAAPIFRIVLNDVFFPVASILDFHDWNYVPVEGGFELGNQESVERIQFFLGSATSGLCKAELGTTEDEFGVEQFQLKLDHFQQIHDGPITLHSHPSFSDIFLTIGGTVFAIWNMELHTPLLWSRTPPEVLYLSGNWTENPSNFILVRSDGVCELWDLLNEKRSIRIIPFGNVGQVFGTVGLEHSRNGTFGVSDELGALKILEMPEALKADYGRVAKVESYFMKALDRRKFLDKWMESFRKSFKKLPEKKSMEIKSGRVSRASTRLTEVERMDRVFAGVEWKTLQQEAIFKTMLELKNLDLEELEEFRQPLQEKFLARKDRKAKNEARLSKKHQFFQSAEADVLPKVEFAKTRKFSLPPLDVGDDFFLLEDYDVIEQRALDYIKCNEYKPTFDWEKMIDIGRDIKQKASVALREVNIHERKK